MTIMYRTDEQITQFDEDDRLEIVPVEFAFDPDDISGVATGEHVSATAASLKNAEQPGIDAQPYSVSGAIKRTDLPRHDIATPVSAAQAAYVRTQRKQKVANKVDLDGDIHSVRPAPKLHPHDWVERVADLLVSPVTRQLRTEYLECTREQFRATLGKVYDSRYAVTEAFMKKPRAVRSRLDGKAPHTIVKLVAALETRGISVPAIDSKQASFNQVLTHLAGKGKSQEFALTKVQVIYLGRRFITIGGKQFTWVNHFGIDCEVDTARALQHMTKLGPTIIMLADFETMLGMDRKEIERRCSLSPH